MAEENIYKKCRTDCGFTRSEASEKLGFITESRLEKIENEKYHITPEEVVAMQNVYRKPNLCNWYCTHECPIGIKYTPQAELKELPQVTIDLIASLNSLQEDKDKLIGIAVNGRVDDFERRDFDAILEKLNSIDRSIQGMKIWLDHASRAGKLDEPVK